MGNRLSSGASRPNHRKNGIEWQGIIRYYSYKTTSRSLDSDLDDLQTHINTETIHMVYLYKKPLFEEQWTSLILYHVYVVFYTETYHYQGRFWWSLEKNGEALILQMSRNLEDVRDKLEGERRISYRNACYWKPKIIIQNSSLETFANLYNFIIVTDQVNLRYNFADENCKKFAKIVFDRIARTKRWSHIF